MELTQSLISGEGISLSEALSFGGVVTGTGLAIVFGVLVILMIILMLFKVIFYKDKKPETKVTKVAPVQKSAHVETTAAETDNGELIAVICAAVAASLGTTTDKLNIKSIRRADNNKPVWNRAGLNDVIGSRY